MKLSNLASIPFGGMFKETLPGSIRTTKPCGVEGTAMWRERFAQYKNREARRSAGISHHHAREGRAPS
jgi:hypothetical protein